MISKNILTVGAGLFALSAATGNAATVILDDFVSVTAVSSNSGTATSGPSPAPSAIGGSRIITVTHSGAANFIDANTGIVPSAFSISNGSFVNGTAMLDYSTPDLDVTSGGDNTALRFRVLIADAATTFTVSITDTATGDIASRTISLGAALSNEDFILPLNTFVSSGASSVNDILTSANEVKLQFSSSVTGWDAAFDVIAFTPVPEPSRAIIGLAGLLAVGLVRRRR